MSTGAISVSRPLVGSTTARARGAAPALLGFALVGYLGVQGGGYEDLVRGQVGVALWWVVALGAALGVLSARLSPTQVVAGGLLTAFAAWTLVSAGWSESAERAVSEAGRDLTLLAAFALAATSIGRAQVRHLLGGVLAGTTLVGAVAVLSRLQPSLFDDPALQQVLPNIGTRLSYPVNYWNALGALMAMGAPLAVGLAMSARTPVARAAALATVPVLALAAALTLSRGAAGCAVLAVLTLLVLAGDPVRLLAKLALAATGATLLVRAAVQRDEVRQAADSALARQQGDELVVVAVVVTLGVLLVSLGASAAAALRERRPSRRASGAVLPMVVAVALVGGLVAAGGPGAVADRWDEFRAPPTDQPAVLNTDDAGRLAQVGGQGRFQYWESMADAYRTDPARGIGAGSFEHWWARNGELGGQVRNAHSLFAETLGELGLVGLVAITGFFGLVLVGGTRNALRAGTDRPLLAGAVGACLAFTASAAIDWSWQVTVLPAIFVLLAATVLTRREGEQRAPGLLRRFGLPVLAALAVAGTVPSMTAGAELQTSRDAATQGKLDQALEAAGGARNVQPYGATPVLQQALVLEQQGRLDLAAVTAQRAIEREPTNWRPHFVLARIETARGNTDEALAAFRRAKRLDRTSGLLR